MNFLYLIIEELLPFVRGCDLLALALTCKFLHNRIFRSRRWKALPLIKDISHFWKYDLLVVDTSCYLPLSIQEQYCLSNYLKTGLPMEVKLLNYPDTIESNNLWLKAVTTINPIRSMDLEILINRGLIPENLRLVGLLDLNVPHDILSQLTRLQSLRIWEVTKSISHFNSVPNLKKLEIQAHYLDCSYLEPLNNVTILRIDTNTIDNVFKLTKWKNLKELSILARIEDISFLEFLDELEFLTLKCELLIAKFPSSPPKKLKKLHLDCFEKENLDWLSGWTSLEIIQIQNTRFLDINSLQTCVNLKKVDLAMATINTLKPLAKCLNLMELRFDRCVKNDWKSLIELENLQYVETRFIDNIPESFSKLKLPRLKIEGYSIGCNLTLSEELLKGLSHLELSRMSLRSIIFLDYATRLTLLQINDCRIKNIQPLSNLVQLEVLDLSSNEIKNISPLSGLLKLRSLNLSANCIVDIKPLSNLLELEKLNLGHNKIRDVKPLFRLKKLFILNLNSNNVPVSDLKKLMRWKRPYFLP